MENKERSYSTAPTHRRARVSEIRVMNTQRNKAVKHTGSERVEDTGHHLLHLTASDVTSHREVVQTPSSGMLRERRITLWKE